MSVDDLHDPGAALRDAAQRPRRPVDPRAVIARGDALRRRRSIGRAALVLLLVVPAAAGLWTLREDPRLDLAQGEPDELVPATLRADDEPPTVLADGSAPTPVPDAVASRFAEPVVAAARVDAMPAQLDGPNPCASAGPGSTLRFDRLRDEAGTAVVHVGPQAATSLAVGTAPAPPAYPDAYAIACMAVQEGPDRLVSPGAVATHLYRGWTGYVAPRGDGGGDRAAVPSWMSALPVPSGASWAVQEHGGWWLAYAVTGDEWLLVQSTQAVPEGREEDIGFPGARVVFLDAAGRTVGEERLGREAIADDAPFLQPQAAGARIRFPDEEALRTELADGPVPACADEVTVCVWLVDVDGAVVALSAAGPVPDEVPPLGAVGWCSSAGRFQAEGTGSAYAPDGSWLAGPSQTGLHRYEVRTGDGAVVVDLSRFSFGPDRGLPTEPPTSGDACPDLVEPGFPLP